MAPCCRELPLCGTGQGRPHSTAGRDKKNPNPGKLGRLPQGEYLWVAAGNADSGNQCPDAATKGSSSDACLGLTAGCLNIEDSIQ